MIEQPEEAIAPTILVVDDEVFICTAIRRALRHDGMEVHTAHSAKEGLSQLEKLDGQVQVVVSDINMPGGMDGIEYLRLVRDRWPNIQRVLLTAYGTHDYLERAINESGVHRFLPKPWRHEVLKDTLDDCLARWRAEQMQRKLSEVIQERNEKLQELTGELEEKVRRRTGLLEQASKRWRQTFDSIRDPMTLIDPEFRIQRANKASAEAADSDIRALNGKHCYTALFGRDTPCEGCPVLAGKVSEDTRTELTDERTGRRWMMHTWPVSEDDESLKGHTVCHYRDVTDFFELQQQVIISEKMAAVGELAGCVAHELNNPLTGILTFSQLLGRSRKAEDAEEFATSIEEQARRCKNIVQSLLDFSRPDSNPMERVDVEPGALIKGCLDVATFRGDPRKGLQIQLELADDLWAIRGNVDGLKSVFLNLLNNALQAIGKSDQGRLVIEAKNITSQGERRVCIVVQDNGPGIPEGNLGRVFQPFFTTKAANKGGTGLGLAIVKRQVEDHGGSVKVDKSPEYGGARFTIELPAAASNQGIPR